jgi:multidrug efflux pump subunit AcrA (membrane-fusion protein)
MYAQAHLHFTREQPVLILPATALLVRSSGPQIVTVDEPSADHMATIHFRPIVVGRDYGGTIEVASGATEGVTVVSNPSADLVDGMKVRLAQRGDSAAR